MATDYAYYTSYPAEWTFQTNFSASWGTVSSTDTYRLQFYVQSLESSSESDKVLIATRSNLTGNSRTITLSATEKQKLISERAKSSGAYWLTLTTYNKSGTSKGSVTVKGKVIIPARNTVYPDSNGYEIGQKHTIEISKGSSFWGTRIDILDENENELLGLDTDETSFEWNLPSTILPVGVKSRKVTIYIASWYNDKDNVYIREVPIVKEMTIKRTVNPPVWNSNITQSVVTATTTPNVITLTGSNKNLVQNLSRLTLQVPTGSVAAQNGAELTKLQIYKGTSYIGYVSPTTTLIDLGTWDVYGQQNITIHALDNYGNSSKKEISINMIPYQRPSITANNIGRKYGYLGIIEGKLSGGYSPIVVSGVAKNALSSIKIYCKLSSSSSYLDKGSYVITHNVSDESYTTNLLQILELETGNLLTEGDTYDVRVIATDKLGNSFTLDKRIGAGMPLVYFDKMNGSIGFNTFPTKPKTFETKLPIITPSGLWGQSGKFGIDMQNSDIINANQIFFNDASDSANEGLQFPRSTAVRDTTTGVFPSNQMDTLRALDGKLIMNSDYIPVIESGTINIKGTTADDQGIYAHQASVTFTTPFLEVPSIMIMANTTVPGTSQLGEGVSGITTTGFTVNGARRNSSQTAYKWVALGFRT